MTPKSIIDQFETAFVAFIRLPHFSWDVNHIALGSDTVGFQNLIFKKVGIQNEILNVSYGFVQSDIPKEERGDSSVLQSWAEKALTEVDESLLLRAMVFLKSISESYAFERYVSDDLIRILDEKKREILLRQWISEITQLKLPDGLQREEPKSVEEWEQVHQYWRHVNDLHIVFRVFSAITNWPTPGFLNSLIDGLPTGWVSALVSLSIHMDRLLSQDLPLAKSILHAEKNRRRYGYIFFHLYDLYCKNLPVPELSELLREYWEDIGRPIMRRVFGQIGYHQRFVDLGTLSVSISDYLRDPPQSIFKNFSWPKDWQAYAGFFLASREESRDNDKPINFAKAEGLQNLAASLFTDFPKGKDYQDKILRRMSLLNLFQIDQPKNQVALSFAIYSMLSASPDAWTEWSLWLKDLLINLRPCYYSSGLVFQMRKIGTEILLLYTSISQYQGLSATEANRLSEHLEVIETHMLYPYLRLIELDEDAWNINRELTTPTWHNIELYLLNMHLQKLNDSTDESFRTAFARFLNSWKKMAKIKWLWYETPAKRKPMVSTED